LPSFIYSHRLENVSSLSSSQNDADSGDDRRSINFSVSEHQDSIGDEENRDSLDVPNETPRIRVVPFVMSPIPFSPQTDSPQNATDTPTTSINNNVSTAPTSFVDDEEDDEDNNHNVVTMGLE